MGDHHRLSSGRENGHHRRGILHVLGVDYRHASATLWRRPRFRRRAGTSCWHLVGEAKNTVFLRRPEQISRFRWNPSITARPAVRLFPAARTAWISAGTPPPPSGTTAWTARWSSAFPLTVNAAVHTILAGKVVGEDSVPIHMLDPAGLDCSRKPARPHGGRVYAHGELTMKAEKSRIMNGFTRSGWPVLHHALSAFCIY